MPRVTLTFPVFDAAREVVFLVAGEDKAEAMARAFGDPPDPTAPAARVRPRDGRLLVLADRAAAARHTLTGASIRAKSDNQVTTPLVFGDLPRLINQVTADPRQLTALIHAQETIAAAGLDAGDVLVALAGHARELTGAAGAIVELVDEDGIVTQGAADNAAVQVGVRLPELSASAARRHAAPAGALGRADGRTPARPARAAAAPSAVVAAPLAVGDDEVVGVVTVIGRPRTPSPPTTSTASASSPASPATRSCRRAASRWPSARAASTRSPASATAARSTRRCSASSPATSATRAR